MKSTRRAVLLGLLALVVLALAACGSSPSSRHWSRTGELSARVRGATGRSIAVVSFTVGRDAHTLGERSRGLTDWPAPGPASPAVGQRLARSLALLESDLARHFEVVPATTLQLGPYAALPSVDAGSDVVPVTEHGPLHVFLDPGARVDATLPPAELRALTQAAGTDLIAIFHARWELAGQRKAYAQVLGILTICDAEGACEWARRTSATRLRHLPPLPEPLSTEIWAVATEDTLHGLLPR